MKSSSTVNTTVATEIPVVNKPVVVETNGLTYHFETEVNELGTEQVVSVIVGYPTATKSPITIKPFGGWANYLNCLSALYTVKDLFGGRYVHEDPANTWFFTYGGCHAHLEDEELDSVQNAEMEKDPDAPKRIGCIHSRAFGNVNFVLVKIGGETVKLFRNSRQQNNGWYEIIRTIDTFTLNYVSVERQSKYNVLHFIWDGTPIKILTPVMQFKGKDCTKLAYMANIFKSLYDKLMAGTITLQDVANDRLARIVTKQDREKSVDYETEVAASDPHSIADGDTSKPQLPETVTVRSGNKNVQMSLVDFCQAGRMNYFIGSTYLRVRLDFAPILKDSEYMAAKLANLVKLGAVFHKAAQ